MIIHDDVWYFPDETTRDVYLELLRLREEEANKTVVNRIQRRQLNCSFCRPNRGENAKRHQRDDRYKNHRRNG